MLKGVATFLLVTLAVANANRDERCERIKGRLGRVARQCRDDCQPDGRPTGYDAGERLVAAAEVCYYACYAWGIDVGF